MKQCPNCKAALDDNARFCLRCMTSLVEKEQIQPSVRPPRRWPLVLLCLTLSAAMVVFILVFAVRPPRDTALPSQPQAEAAADPQSEAAADPQALTCVVEGVSYTFRPATRDDHPTAIRLEDHFVLIRVEGTPPDGIYRVPTFVDDDPAALVSVVADGAFAGTHAQAIDLGYNVRYVWGDAFGGYALTDLYLHEDVLIDRAAFSGCSSLTIHSPDYLENTQGILWSDLCAEYGFHWQQEGI